MCLRVGAPTAEQRVSPRDAAVALARMMEKKLYLKDGAIDEVALRRFLTESWTRVSILAHAIHEDQQ